MSSGWAELGALGVTCRPFEGSPPPVVGSWARFRTGWSTTVKLLARELEYLEAETIVLELDVTERNLRADGLPRADARLATPAVRISFLSKWGPLRYETGEYHLWQDNMRAIALSMEALRKVDRYGVSKRGEQYRGWRAIESGSGTDVVYIETTAQATRVIAAAAGDWDETDVRANPVDAVRAAIKKTHPDAGGNPAIFRQVLRAKEVLKV